MTFLCRKIHHVFQAMTHFCNKDLCTFNWMMTHDDIITITCITDKAVDETL